MVSSFDLSHVAVNIFTLRLIFLLIFFVYIMFYHDSRKLYYDTDVVIVTLEKVATHVTLRWTLLYIFYLGQNSKFFVLGVPKVLQKKPKQSFCKKKFHRSIRKISLEKSRVYTVQRTVCKRGIVLVRDIHYLRRLRS